MRYIVVIAVDVAVAVISVIIIIMAHPLFCCLFFRCVPFIVIPVVSLLQMIVVKLYRSTIDGRLCVVCTRASVRSTSREHY